MAFTITSETGILEWTITLNDASAFPVGSPITGDGVNGNNGVGIVLARNGSILTVDAQSGIFVDAEQVDNQNPYAAPSADIVTAVYNDDIIFQRVGKGEARGVGVMAYVDYTKNGDTLQLQFSFNEVNVDDQYYQEIAVVNDALEVLTIDIGATGLYRVPIAIADNEDSVKVTTIGGVDGTFNIEFRQDQGHK